MGVAEDAHGAGQPVEAVERQTHAEEDIGLLGQQPRRAEGLRPGVLQGQAVVLFVLQRHRGTRTRGQKTKREARRESENDDKGDKKISTHAHPHPHPHTVRTRFNKL